MACDNGAYIGKLALVEFSIGCSDTPPASYLPLGGTRGLSINGEWGTIDVTNRDSAGSVRERLADYIDFTGSVDGTTLQGSASNQKLLRRHVWSPADGQPKGWMRFTLPEEGGAVEIIEMPVIYSSNNLELPYEDLASFSLDWQGDGEPVFTDVPA